MIWFIIQLKQVTKKTPGWFGVPGPSLSITASKFAPEKVEGLVEFHGNVLLIGMNCLPIFQGRSYLLLVSGKVLISAPKKNNNLESQVP